MSSIRLLDGSLIALRPLEVDDGERLHRLFHRLSPTSVYRRFMSPIPHLTPSLARRLLDLDHRNREALAAMDGDELIAVVRYTRCAGTDEADLAVVVADVWQHQGLGRALLRRLAAVASRRGIRAFRATILGDNVPVLRLLRLLSEAASMRWEQGVVVADIPLRRHARQARADAKRAMLRGDGTVEGWLRLSGRASATHRPPAPGDAPCSTCRAGA